MITIKNARPFEGAQSSTETKLSAFILSDNDETVNVSFFLDGSIVDKLYDVPSNSSVTTTVNLSSDKEYEWYISATGETEGTVVIDPITFSSSPALSGNFYRQLHDKIFQAWLDGTADDIILQEVKRNNNMEHTYNKLGDITKFLEYLDKKAKLLESGDKGIILSSIGGRHEL